MHTGHLKGSMRTAKAAATGSEIVEAMSSAEQLLIDAASHDSFKAACPKHFMMTGLHIRLLNTCGSRPNDWLDVQAPVTCLGIANLSELQMRVIFCVGIMTRDVPASWKGVLHVLR